MFHQICICTREYLYAVCQKVYLCLKIIKNSVKSRCSFYPVVVGVQLKLVPALDVDLDVYENYLKTSS